MPKTVYLAAVRDAANSAPDYVKKGGGWTKEKTRAKRFKRRDDAWDDAKNRAEVGQLYDAEPYTLPAK